MKISFIWLLEILICWAVLFAGQMWPLQKLYRLAGRQAYGEFKYPGTMLYVTAGESDWMMPLRTEEHCEWDLITIRP